MGYKPTPLSDIYKKYNTDPEKGLSDHQALHLQKIHGKNEFQEHKKESIPQKILHHLKDFATIILLIATAISTYLSIVEGQGFTEPIVILSILIIGIVLSIYQELDAERALESLKQMQIPTAIVIRNGKRQQINTVNLVPGDILSLESGDQILADARLIDARDLFVDESVLTGESTPVEKDEQAEIPDSAPTGDRINMVFSGCLITGGRATAIVVGTGMHTEIGKIASLLGTPEHIKTPLQKRTIKLGKLLTTVAIASALLLFTVQFFFQGSHTVEVLMNAVALAVAAIPETLPIIVTITLAFGVRVMARKNAIIRQIPAVETLGSATVICTDKTGTLTLNSMTIKSLWIKGSDPFKSDTDFTPAQLDFLRSFDLTTNVSTQNIHGQTKFIGDPTEIAISKLLREKDHAYKKPTKTAEIPFSSERKICTLIYENKNGGYTAYIAGALEQIPLSPRSTKDLQSAQLIQDQFAEKALRVIALAKKHIDKLPDEAHLASLEKDFELLGLVGMIDPPRRESAASIKTAQEAGIRTIMITGDHATTATAIAREIGILSSNQKVITGTELAKMSDKTLATHVKEYSVYARVSPSDKIRIVRAWQSHGEVVAMTGDGVNDAPALKAADVGVAMGSGTDVSKNASDMVLADDNFASIIHAVAEGRRVYDNIRKSLLSLLSDNFAEVIVILFAVIAGWGIPLVAIQLLFINVISDGVPDMFFCREPAEDNIMKRRPINKKEGLFANGLASFTVRMTLVLAIITLAGFYIGKFILPTGTDPATAHMTGQTMAFIINSWSSVINSFNMRSFKKSIFKIGLKSNRWLSYGILGSMALTALVATVPFLAEAFQVVPLTITHWAIIAALAIAPLVIGEIHKLITRLHGGNKLL